MEKHLIGNRKCRRRDRMLRNLWKKLEIDGSADQNRDGRVQ